MRSPCRLTWIVLVSGLRMNWIDDRFDGPSAPWDAIKDDDAIIILAILGTRRVITQSALCLLSPLPGKD